MPIVPDSVLRFHGAAAAAAGLCIAVGGCVQTRKAMAPQPAAASVESPDNGAIPKSLSSLARKAAAEASLPRKPVTVDVLPPGITPALAERLQPGANADPIRTSM